MDDDMSTMEADNYMSSLAVDDMLATVSGISNLFSSRLISNRHKPLHTFFLICKFRFVIYTLSSFSFPPT